MSKRRNAGIKQARQRRYGVHLAIDHGRARRRWGRIGGRGQLLILLVFASIVAGFLFARTRIHGGEQYSAHDIGVPYIPGTSVHFGQDQPANANSDAFGEAVDPDTTQVPAPQAEGVDAGGGEGGAIAE